MLNILIVDDSLIIRKNLTRIVKKTGHNVVYLASSGVEAVEEYQKQKPDLVTMDITMPDMNGIEAVRHIVAIDEDAKIIMITSHGQEEMVIKAIQSGAMGYLLKPINEDKLIESIGKIFPEYAKETSDDIDIYDDIF